MKTKLLIFFLALSLLACSKKEKEVKLRKTVQNLVDSLAISDKAYPNTVFIADDYPKAKSYKSYHKFIKTTTEEELKKLTEHQSPNIRCYAFYSLVKRNSSAVKKILLEHLNDTSKIHLSFGGCVVLNSTVKEFMLDQLHPKSSKSSEKISREEYDQFQKIDVTH